MILAIILISNLCLLILGWLYRSRRDSASDNFASWLAGFFTFFLVVLGFTLFIVLTG